MPTHKFHVGQLVQLIPCISRNVSGGTYEVTKQLPESRGEFEYRIKSMNERHERVVRESELQGVWSAYPDGPAAVSQWPDPIVVVATPSFMVEPAYDKPPF
jgi:hypothetical protein